MVTVAASTHPFDRSISPEPFVFVLILDSTFDCALLGFALDFALGFVALDIALGFVSSFTLGFACELIDFVLNVPAFKIFVAIVARVVELVVVVAIAVIAVVAVITVVTVATCVTVGIFGKGIKVSAAVSPRIRLANAAIIPFDQVDSITPNV